jgi:signal transduction histidine kinase/CheY-like chemotaxis protein
LAHQNQEVERKYREVEQARQALEGKAKQPALTSKYKSEFLANMSHELRTPLNSLLILSDQLSKNPDGNLTPRQTEFAKTIHSSGNDLLMLINDILDLSKIECGTVVLDVGELRFADLTNYVERTFRHVAESKGVGFTLELDSHLPKSLFTDSKRLQQVIKNLLSNGFKLTHHGQVSLTIGPAEGGWTPGHEGLDRAPSVVAFSVSDTGIGSSSDKQQIIFEAFQQADGSTSRKYGGTGLGLAISREISRLLGGEIKLLSSPGRGSTFTLYLPLAYTPRPAARKAAPEAAPAPPPPPVADAPSPAEAETRALVNEAGDDRDSIRAGDRVVLIVENDLHFARFLLDAAREQGLKGLVTSLGASALAMTRDFKPEAITLDICLPDIDGWRVLERLKKDIHTRHVPVCVISTEEVRERSLRLGAWGFLLKPVPTKEALEQCVARLKEYAGRPSRNLLVVSGDPTRRDEVLSLLDDLGVRAAGAGGGRQALDVMRNEPVDCLVLDRHLPDMTVEAFAAELAGNRTLADLPLIIYGKKDVSGNGEGGHGPLAGVANARRANSRERLLDQVTLALHCPPSRLPDPARQTLDDLHRTDKVLAGRKVLVVDDDIRNIFALTSVLERHNMVVVPAETGREAIDALQPRPDIDVVLMDIMMPEMDGMDTMRAIRQRPQFKSLPIIAVTAKAMKGDREKCIEAGAWDYLSKPVDTEQMLAVLRGWLHR